jgi:transportin-3
MIEQFGSDPAMAGALLEFLQVLAEEFTNNLKITVTSDFGRGPDVDAQGQPIRRGEQLVNLVSMYVAATGKHLSQRSPLECSSDRTTRCLRAFS